MFHLIGPPAVGKYTIGKELAALMGAKLVDNHAIANVIFNLLDQDGIKPLPPEVWPRVGQVRRAAIDTIIHLSPRYLSFVLTNYIRGDDEQEAAVLAEMVAVAEIRGSLFVPVLLRCESDEIVQRADGPGRRERMKLIDPMAVGRFNDDVPPFETDHPNTLRLDTTRVPPGDSARALVDWAAGLA